MNIHRQVAEIDLAEPNLQGFERQIN